MGRRRVCELRGCVSGGRGCMSRAGGECGTVSVGEEVCKWV